MLLALGAHQGSILWLVLRGTQLLNAAGLPSTGLLESRLIRLPAAEPATRNVAAATLLGADMAARACPATTGFVAGCVRGL